MFKLILYAKAKALVFADCFWSHFNVRGFSNRSKSLNQLQVIIYITIVVSKVREGALNLLFLIKTYLSRAQIFRWL